MWVILDGVWIKSDGTNYATGWCINFRLLRIIPELGFCAPNLAVRLSGFLWAVFIQVGVCEVCALFRAVSGPVKFMSGQVDGFGQKQVDIIITGVILGDWVI